jgi:monoamine oxidase
VDFAVVGAGLAGLQTAVALAGAGASVTVFEARDRVGGRVLSALPRQTLAGGPPLVLDLGAQWVGPGQVEVLRLIRELRLHLVPTAVPGRAVWALNGRVRQGGPALAPMPPRALADMLAGGARLALMCRQVSPDAPWQARHAEEWDHLTAGEWIQRHLRTPAARAYAQTLIRGNGAIEPGETSLLNLLFDLRSTGSGRNLARAEMFRVRQGTHELARRLSEPIRDRIRLAEPVRAIAADADGVTVESDQGTLRCRRVAVCVPPPLAADIAYSPALPERRARLLSSLPMGAAVKFHAVYGHPFWRSQGLSGQVVSSAGTVSLTYDNSPADGTGRGGLVGLVVADEARRLSQLGSSAQERAILASLGGLLGPRAEAPDALVTQDWCREEWTRGCYAAHFPPGVWTSDGPAFRAPCGRIHWAGTETSSAWHGYMEGALRSARRAATEMLEADASGGSPA